MGATNTLAHPSADSTHVDAIADALMELYPGWRPTEAEREQMKIRMRAATTFDERTAMKIGRLLRSSPGWAEILDA